MTEIQFNRVGIDVENTQFDCGVSSINGYIKESYYPSIIQHAYSYSIEIDNIVLGYYQVYIRDNKLECFPEDIADYMTEFKDCISSVHIRFIAIDKKYQRNQIGTMALQAIMQIIKEMSKNWPIRVITIDAREDLVGWYEKLGFHIMSENTVGQDGVTVAMYCDCMNYSAELMDYVSG